MAQDETVLGNIIEFVQETIKEPIFATSYVESPETIDTQPSLPQMSSNSLFTEEVSSRTAMASSSEDNSEIPLVQSETTSNYSTQSFATGSMSTSASAPPVPTLNTEKQFAGKDDLLPPPSYQDVMRSGASEGETCFIPPQPAGFIPSESKPYNLPSDDNSSGVPSLTLQFSCVARTESDSKRCRIAGALFLSNGTVVLADKNNNNIKLLNVNNRTIIAEFETGAAPFGLAEIPVGCIAVSCPKRNQILFLKIESLPITVERCIQLDQPCLGIACAKGQAVCCL